jgi:hypothetical protein
MKRDMDLVRELLLKLEAEPFDGNVWLLNPDSLGIKDHTQDQIAYHLLLLIDSGFLEGERALSGEFMSRKLTWAGHDFLDSVRDPKIWRATKERVKEAGGFTMELLAGVAKEIISHNLVRLAGAAIGS